MTENKINIAIAGSPNSGKTTIFNALTGTRQKVGNYPGVTVEKKEGRFSHEGTRIETVDLPGTYSLAAVSLDEKVARDYIMDERPDVVVDVVDASNFERNLYLTAQLLELGVNLVLVLNMSDRARAQGQVLDLDMIRERLGCEVVETVGTKSKGIAELKCAIVRVAGVKQKCVEVDYGDELGAIIDEISASIQSIDERCSRHGARWMAIKILEDDRDVRNRFLELHPNHAPSVVEKAGELRKKVEGHHGDSFDILLAERRYGFAAGLYREVLKREKANRRHISEHIDDIVTNRILGIPLFLGLMYLVFYVTFTVGEIPMRWIESGFGILAQYLTGAWPGDGPLKSLVIDGVIGGVGGVLVFLPNIVLLFMCISLLEDTGYMSRAAFIMDRLMHKIGLHGKSFIPMMIGFGCSVPAIMATRTLENRRDRLSTMLVVPLMSCGARLPIYTLIIPAFFPEAWRPRVLWIVYIVGIVLAVTSVKLLRSSVLRGESAPFVMELPPYRMPTVKGIFIHMWERSKLYLRKAGTVILAISIIMWVLTAYPKPPVEKLESALSAKGQASAEMVKASEDVRHSYAGRIGRAIEPIIRPLGFDWRIGTGLFGAIAAKEVFVSQLGIIYSLDDSEEGVSVLREKLRTHYTPLVGLCIMLFCLVSAPCMATIAVTRRESGSWKWALFQLGGLTIMAYVLTLIVYQVGSAMGWGLA